MKKALVTIIPLVVLLSLSHLAAGQVGSENLDYELVEAAGNGDAAAVLQLLQQGANIEATGRFGDTPLLRAIQMEKVEMVRLLLEKGADANSRGGVALAMAADQGNMEMVRLLLDKGANPEGKDGFGGTALLKAVERGNIDVVKLLLDKGANTEAKSGNGPTALHLAATRGDTEVVKLLLEKGANIDAGNGVAETALHGAAGSGRTAVVKLLLERGANTEARAQFGYTPLHVAAEEGHAEVAKQLMDSGAKLEAKDDHGETPLHVAAHRASAEVVKLLLDKGANIEARDNDDFTPLLCAAEAGGILHIQKQGIEVENFPAVDVVNLLLDRGANIEARSNWGQTALHRAAFQRRPDVVKLLLERGANIQAMDDHGNTALNLANESRRGFARVTGQMVGPQSQVYQQSADRLVSTNAEVIRVLEEALAQHPPSNFAEYVRDLQNHPRDRARRDNVVKLAAALPTLPPIPEQATQLFVRASALMKQASGPKELDLPINLLRAALIFAPWWRDAYYQLSRALELSGQYDLAVKNLNYYIELNPPAAEARAARDHLLEIQSEMGAGGREEQ